MCTICDIYTNRRAIEPCDPLSQSCFGLGASIDCQKPNIQCEEQVQYYPDTRKEKKAAHPCDELPVLLDHIQPTRPPPSFQPSTPPRRTMANPPVSSTLPLLYSRSD